MINLHDIETAIAERLKSAGHTVTAAEIEEGFEKPTFFIDVFQNSATRENPFMERVNVGVELSYFHDKPTRAVMVTTADALSVLFTEEPIQVVDRFLTVQELTFDKDGDTFLAFFELEFMREPAAKLPEHGKMQNLEIGVRTSGTTPNFN